MIPLIYILPSDDIYRSASGIITKVTPTYSHYRHSIQIEFRYNLDEFFYIEVSLSEFDQPKTISLIGYYRSDKIEVSDDVDEYHLVGKKVSLKIQKDTVLSIVNNVITTGSFEAGTEVSLKVIKDDSLPIDRPRMTSFSITPYGIEMTINGIQMKYKDGDRNTLFMPVLEFGGTRLDPNFVDGKYNIFNLPDPMGEWALVAIPPSDIHDHYLFRENPALLSMRVEDDGELSTLGQAYYYNNGMIESVGRKISMQKFLEAAKDTSPKQYIFNAARDKNLYTEISLLWPAVRHNSMVVYDLNSSDMIRGEVSYSMVPDNASGKIMHKIHMSNCVTFYGESVDKEFVYMYDPMLIVNENPIDVNNAAEYGDMYVIDTSTGASGIEILDASFQHRQDVGYMTSSNLNYVISINIHRAISESRKMRGGSFMFKQITPNDYVVPMYTLARIDYEEGVAEFDNGTITESVDIESIGRFVMSADYSMVGSIDRLSSFGGVSLSIPPVAIDMYGINITNFSDYAMLCRTAESPSYGIAGVKKGTANLSYSMIMSFQTEDVAFIYNKDLDKVYYVNFDKKEVVTSPSEFGPTFSKFISSVDEGSLKSFLVDRATGNFISKKTGMASIVSYSEGRFISKQVIFERVISDELEVDNIAFMSDGESSFSDLVYDESNERFFLPKRESDIVLGNKFGQLTSIYRQVLTGFYSNKPMTVKSVSVSPDQIDAVFDYDGRDISVSVSTNGGPFEFKKGLYDTIQGGETGFSYPVGISISTNINYEKMYQVGGAIVIESAFDAGMVINYQAIESMVAAQALGTYGSISIAVGEEIMMVRCGDTQEITVSGDTVSVGNEQFTMSEPAHNTIAAITGRERGSIRAAVPFDRYKTMISRWRDGSLETIGTSFIKEYKSGQMIAISHSSNYAPHIQIKGE